jgi:hypothetical protein
MDFEIVCALKERYSDLSPLLFNRSVERSKNTAELFDILDTVPPVFPLAWNAVERRWEQCCLFTLPQLHLLEGDSDESL